MSQNTEPKKTVAIIGAGAAGLTTAWLLEHDYEVTLYEKENRLGGNAYTVEVPTEHGPAYIDSGFEFFSDALFDHFKTLLGILNVPTKRFQLTYTMFNKEQHNDIALPLIYHSRISWEVFKPRNLFYLIQFDYFVIRGKKLIEAQDTTTTIEQYTDSLWISNSFKHNFLYPILSSGWGVSIDEFKKLSAFDALMWSVNNSFSGFKPMYWYQIVGGTRTYINALANNLLHTKIKKNTTIANITYHNNKYVITDLEGTSLYFDYLIFANSAEDILPLLNNIEHAQKARQILQQVTYYSTSIAIHSDERFMPKDKNKWSIANVRYTPELGLLTIYNPSASKNIFKSWIMPKNGEPLPSPLHALVHFRHAYVSPTYFQVQRELKTIQGNHNIFFAGTYTRGMSSHENALNSAIIIAQTLAPYSKRLAQLNARKHDL